MGISIDEVRRVARLARLDFPPGELEKLTAQLSAVVDYIEHLRSVDTEGVEPDFGPPASEAQLRPDAPGDCLEPSQALANAPDAAAGHFRVPRVIG